MTISIRKLERPEQELFCEHLLGLDKNDRADRFGTFQKDEQVAEYAGRAFGNMSVSVYGALNDGELIGVCELHAASTPAEIALSVEKDWRRKRVASRLLAFAVRAAGDMGIRTLQCTFEAHNEAVRSLLRSVNGSVSVFGDTAEGSIDIRAPVERKVALSPSALYLVRALDACLTEKNRNERRALLRIVGTAAVYGASHHSDKLTRLLERAYAGEAIHGPRLCDACQRAAQEVLNELRDAAEHPAEVDGKAWQRPSPRPCSAALRSSQAGGRHDRLGWVVAMTILVPRCSIRASIERPSRSARSS